MGIYTNLVKIQAIISLLEPETIHGIRSLYGLATFYRCFNKGFSMIMASIMKCMKMRGFYWMQEAAKTFRLVKK